jgi:hypothetical protein
MFFFLFLNIIISFYLLLFYTYIIYRYIYCLLRIFNKTTYFSNIYFKAGFLIFIVFVNKSKTISSKHSVRYHSFDINVLKISLAVLKIIFFTIFRSKTMCFKFNSTYFSIYPISINIFFKASSNFSLFKEIFF